MDAGPLCYHCQYDLRGIPQDRRCPECGEPVLHTLNLIKEGAYGPPVRFARQLTIAAWITLPMMCLGLPVPVSPVLAVVAFAASIACFRRRDRATPQERRTTRSVLIGSALLVGLYVLLLIVFASINFC